MISFSTYVSAFPKAQEMVFETGLSKELDRFAWETWKKKSIIKIFVS